MTTPAPTKAQLTQQLEEMKAELQKQQQHNITLQQQIERSQEEVKETQEDQQSNPQGAGTSAANPLVVADAPAPSAAPAPTSSLILQYLHVFNRVRAVSTFEGSQEDITGGRVSTWVMEVTNTFNVMGLREEPTPTNPIKAQMASTLLKAGAMKWWENKTNGTTMTDPIYTWEGFKKEILKQYLPVTSFDLAYDKLLSLPETMSKHNHTGEVNSYVNEFRTLLMSIQNTMDDDTQLRLFTRGLHPQIRKELQIHPPRDLEDCFNRAIKSDTIYRVSRSTSNNLRNNYPSKRPAGITTTSTFTPNRPRVFPSNRLNNMQEQNEAEEQVPSYEELLALFQKSKNPTTKTQPWSARTGSQPGSAGILNKLTPAEREKLMKEGACFRCKVKGHMARDCPKKL